jgi:hypothetical protein
MEGIRKILDRKQIPPSTTTPSLIDLQKLRKDSEDARTAPA